MVSLTNISEIATQVTNITGTMDPILEIQPKDGTVLVIENFNPRGDEEIGIPIFAELKDQNGNDLPQDSEMALEYEKAADDKARVVTETFDNINPYRSLSIQDQQNTDYIDAVKHVLQGRAIVVEQTDTLYVSLDSDTEIDWNNSRLQFAERNVREV